MPLINLQAVPAWKWFVLSAEQVSMCRFLKQAEDEGQKLPCRSLPCRCSWTSPTLCHHHMPGLSFTFGMSLTQTLHGTARWSCFHPLGLSKAPGWQTEPQSSRLVPQAPACCWGETSSLHSLCVVLTTLWRESYPGHPHRSLWPPQPIAVSELLKSQALPVRRWTNFSLRSCLH